MSYGNYYLPSVGGSNSYSTSYSYSSNNAKPQTSTQNNFYSDPFAKPANYGYSSNFGYGFPSSNFSTAGYNNTNNTNNYATPGYGYAPSGNSGYGNYGNYGNYSSNTSYNPAPAPSTQYGGNTSNPSAPNYGIASAALGGLGGFGFGGSTKPSTNAGGSNSGSNSNTSYGGYSYGGSTKPDPYASQPQQQSSSYAKPYTPIPTQLSTGEINDLSKAGKQLFANAYSKSSTKSAYQDLLNQLKASGQKYKDLDFPPELRSLTGGLSEYELAASGNPLNWRSLVWLRAEEIYGKNNFQVFLDDIEPNDVDQGALGDCYFLSTLASLAEIPDRIRKIFETDKPNEQGCYAIRICDTGIWQTIIMDDYLPCSAKSKQPCFTKGNGNEIWVQLLEKAWAKVYGSYARIEAGLTRECLHDLTGAPTKYYLTGDPAKYDEIWHAIEHGEKKNYAMTCGAGDFFEGADLMSSIGLVGSHAYSLLAALEVTDRYGKKVKLVKLRNPWGKGEWTGDWSDESPTWTEELKKKLNVEDRDDGIFYMSFQDMLKYFSDIQICKIHDDFKYKAIKSTCDSKHAVYFKITVRTPGHYFITINQESKRKHAESENYQYSEVYLVLGKKTGNEYKYVEGYQRADKEVWTDGHLDAGEYIAYAKIAWNNGRPKDFSISSYGQGEVDIEQIPKTYCADFIEKVYLNKGRQFKKVEDYQHCGVNNCYRALELTDDGFGYIYYRNESNKTLEEEIYFKFLEGLKLRKPYRGNSFKIAVPPGQERIVITKVLPNAARIRQAFTEKSRFV